MPEADAAARPNRLLAEKSLDMDESPHDGRRARRTVTVNLAESPLGWLKARGLVSLRQFEAGRGCAGTGRSRGSARA